VRVNRSWLWSIRGVQSILFIRSSAQFSVLITCLDLFRFPHCFAEILWSWFWFASLTRSWIVLFVRFDLDSGSTSFVLFVNMNRRYATQSRRRSRSRYRDPWMGYSWRLKLSSLFKQKDQGEDLDSRRKKIFFPKVICHNPLVWSVEILLEVSKSLIIFSSWVLNPHR